MAALALVQLLLASAEQGRMLRFRHEIDARGWAPMIGL
jgi:hypothetical protein